MTPSNLYQINGNPLLPPDEDVVMSFTDLDAADAGRDESGFLHRVVVRRKLGSWSFVYSRLTQEEYAYMMSILPTEGQFTFTHPKLSDCTKWEDTTAYLDRYSIVWHSAKTKDYRNLKFSITEC